MIPLVSMLGPMPRTGPTRVHPIEAMGHLAVWAGCYAVGCVLFVAAVCGTELPVQGMVVAFLATTGTYLLDRVGIGPGLPDRADVKSVPRRVHFLRRGIPGVRGIALALLVAAVALVAADGWLVAVIVPAAVVGMLAYGHAPGERRIKDVLLLKNIVVSVSLTAMAIVLAHLDGQTWHTTPTLVAAVAIGLHVLSGAMLCDVDDRHADARQGTSTLPNCLGVGGTWWIADALAIGAGGVVLLAIMSGWIDQGHLLLAVLPPLAILLLHVAQPKRVRNLVDISFPVAVAAAVLISGWTHVESTTPDPLLSALEQPRDVAAMAYQYEHRNEPGDGQRWCVSSGRNAGLKILAIGAELHEQCH